MEVYGLMMAHTIGCIVDGDLVCCIIVTTFYIEPDRRRLHKLLSPQIWWQLAEWILSYGQKPLAAGYTVAEDAMVWSLEVVLCVVKKVLMWKSQKERLVKFTRKYFQRRAYKPCHVPQQADG